MIATCADHRVEWNTLYLEYRCPNCNRPWSIHEIVQYANELKKQVEEWKNKYATLAVLR